MPIAFAEDRVPRSSNSGNLRVDAAQQQQPGSAGPLLRTKLFIPSPRPRLVKRPHLLSKINEGVQLPLTLVSAPAGFGKTNLLAEWAVANSLPIAWVSLDSGDNDPHRFLSYLNAALNGCLADFGSGAQKMLEAFQPISALAILATVINELSEPGEDFVLVLDDYQSIDSSVINEAVTFIVDHMPPRMHLVIATRSDPALPLSRWRARNQMAELRTEDLRFTQKEVSEFLTRVMELDLSDADIAALESRTEGWVTGLQMAALSLRGRQDASEFVRSFSGSHRYLLEYLIEEVLNRQSENVRSFLMCTSILDRLCAPLCDALFEQAYDSQEMLQSLEKANLFLVPLDDECRWYRYHHLFADLLQSRLRQEQPGAISILHLRASNWYEGSGRPVEAIDHALAAKEYVRAAHLIDQSKLFFLSRGELTTLLNFIKALPESVMRQKPMLNVWFGLGLTFAGELESVEAHLQAAEGLIDAGENSPLAQEIHGTSAATRSIIADIRGDIPAAIAYAQLADELLPENNRVARSLIPFVMSDGYFALGELEKADQACAEILEIGRAMDVLWTISIAQGKLTGIRKVQGRLRDAEAIYLEALQLAAEKGGQHFGTLGGLHIGYADLLRERNQLDDARQITLDAIGSMSQWISPSDLLNGYTLLGRVLLAQGDLDGAKEAFDKGDDPLYKTGVFQTLRRFFEIHRVRLWLASGELSLAANWAERILGDQSGAGHEMPGLPGELEGIARAQVLIALGRPEDALVDLSRLEQAAQSGKRYGRLIAILTTQALALQAQGMISKALESLTKSMLIAVPEGYVRSFLDEGQPMQDLLRLFKVSDRRISGYVKKLLLKFEHEVPFWPSQPPSSQPGYDSQILNEPLSSREAEVLRWICAGLSNQEISAKLVISMNTVKRHNNSIFSKLGVANRAQAIVRAQQLGLVKTPPA